MAAMSLRRRACCSLLQEVIKMARCPKCKEEIDFLLFHVDVACMLMEKGDIAFDTEDIDDDAGLVKDFLCPECGEIIFTDKQEADNFLKGTHLEQKVLE